jgi:hypothetical protein
MGKTRDNVHPYIIIAGGGWEWRVMKAYTADPDAQYARWFCAVSSPHTFGGADWGDTYISDILYGMSALRARITYLDPTVPESDLPEAMRAGVNAE